MQGLVQSTWNEAKPNNQSEFERRRTNFDLLDTKCGIHDLRNLGLLLFKAFNLLKDLFN